MNTYSYIQLVGLSEAQWQHLKDLAERSNLSRPGYVRASLQLVLDYGYIPNLDNDRGSTGQWVKRPHKRCWYMTHPYHMQVVTTKEFAHDVNRAARKMRMKRQGYTYQVVAWALDQGIIYHGGEPVWTTHY